MSNQDDLTTQPTALAIMERLQEVEFRLAKGIEGLSAQFSSFRDEVNEFRDDFNTFRDDVNHFRDDVNNFRDDVNKSLQVLSYKMEVLNEDVLSVRGSQREIIKRMREMEPKAS